MQKIIFGIGCTLMLHLIDAIGYLRHGLASQGALSTKSPSHIAPPFIGAGLLQYRVRSWTPKPQLTEHGSQACQSDHLPSTRHGKYIYTVSKT